MVTRVSKGSREGGRFAPDTSGKKAPTIARKPSLAKTINDAGKVVKIAPDKPHYVRQEKNPYANAKLGTQNYIWKQYLNATEAQALKMYSRFLNETKNTY